MRSGVSHSSPSVQSIKFGILSGVVSFARGSGSPAPFAAKEVFEAVVEVRPDSLPSLRISSRSLGEIVAKVTSYPIVMGRSGALGIQVSSDPSAPLYFPGTAAEELLKSAVNAARLSEQARVVSTEQSVTQALKDVGVIDLMMTPVDGVDRNSYLAPYAVVGASVEGTAEPRDNGELHAGIVLTFRKLGELARFSVGFVVDLDDRGRPIRVATV